MSNNKTSQTKNEITLAEHIGQRIRFFRKMKHVSLDQLSSAIFRSKSTLSKYEHGSIPIDVNTLNSIAKFLGISVNQLIDYELYQPKMTLSEIPNPFGSMDHLYMYYYDGRSKRIVKSLLIMNMNAVPDLVQNSRNTLPCQFYNDYPDSDDFSNCKYYFTGTVTFFDLLTHVDLYNLTSSMDRLRLSILNPFHYNQVTWGFELGLSYNPISPHVRKFMVSTTKVADNKLDKDQLVFTKMEIKKIKDMNMMILNNLDV